MKTLARLSSLWPYALASAAGLVWFIARFGRTALDPTNIDWVMNGADWSQHLSGWLFYRNEPWHFPLGKIAAYAYPLGSTVGFTDSNPWLSVLFKLFSNRLPVDFQFTGLWLCFCFVLQGTMGAALIGAFTRSGWVKALGGCLFVLSPVLNSRTGHDTLCAHFVLLALLALYLRPLSEAQSPRVRLGLAFALIVFAAGTHPTLWAIALTLAVPLAIKYTRENRLRWRESAAWCGGMLTASALILASFGYFSGPDRGAWGFGHFSADLLAPFSPMGFSRILPNFSQSQGQYEGLAYLGLGSLSLMAMVIALAIAQRKDSDARVNMESLKPLLVGVALATVFSWADIWRVAGHAILEIRKLYDSLRFVTTAFRSSGRFIWPLHYLAMGLIVAGTLKVLRGRTFWVTAALVLAVTLQLVDLPLYANNTRVTRTSWYALGAPELSSLAQGRRHLVLFPRQLEANSKKDTCPTDGTLPLHLHISAGYFAYSHGMTTNSGYLARVDSDAAERGCHDLLGEVEKGQLDPQSLYLVSSADLPRFTRAGARCQAFHEFSACTSTETTAAMPVAQGRH